MSRPGRSGDPLPYVPSPDGTRLAVVIVAVERELVVLALALPTGRVHTERLHGMATTLRHLADHVDAVCGVGPGEISESKEE